MSEYTASIIGGSGYTGGELLRILRKHPDFEAVQTTSRSYSGRKVGSIHPDLRDADLRFSEGEELEEVDVLFSATPKGVTMENIDRYRAVADKVVDLSSDFRLNDIDAYREWYGEHERPDIIQQFEYALPEVNRENLSSADLIAAGGCNATASILGLYPLREILSEDIKIIVDAKVGSSEGGSGGGRSSSHAERSGIIRPYAPTEHRHAAEVSQAVGVEADFTAHAVEMVRGAYATIHVMQDIEKKDMWKRFREEYGEEPFVRFTSGSGIYRYPQPKNVAGTNYGEIGFETGEGRVVIFSAIDNLVKGSAGQAVQAVNISLGLEETRGLGFEGIHPSGTP